MRGLLLAAVADAEQKKQPAPSTSQSLLRSAFVRATDHENMRLRGSIHPIVAITFSTHLRAFGNELSANHTSILHVDISFQNRLFIVYIVSYIACFVNRNRL